MGLYHLDPGASLRDTLSQQLTLLTGVARSSGLRGKKPAKVGFFVSGAWPMQGSAALEPLRTRIYIDGYNFYYGCLRHTSLKWLDPLALFERHILPSINATDCSGRTRHSRVACAPALKFFTAKIVASVAQDADSVSSQARYHSALRKFHGPRIELIEGWRNCCPTSNAGLSRSALNNCASRHHGSNRHPCRGPTHPAVALCPRPRAATLACVASSSRLLKGSHCLT